MITDIEMNAIWKLTELCEDKLSKDILDVVGEMFGNMDTDYLANGSEEQKDFLQEYADDINHVVAFAEPPKRMVGDYEILCSFPYGDKEIFLGENLNAANNVERYIVGDIILDDILIRYENCLCGDDYNEIATLYSQKIAEQVQAVKDNLDKFPYDRTIIGRESCDSISDVNLKGEIVVIASDAIKREYAGADRQLCIAMGGHGCSPEAGNKKVFCKNIFTGNDVTWYRSEILGTLKAECMPEWVKERMTDKPIEVLFTFGSSKQFPFQMGYVSIIAPSVKEAIAEFRRHYPDRHENCLNCSDYYYQPESVAEIKEHGNGAGCHSSIDITIPKSKDIDSLIAKATQKCETLSKDVVQKDNVEFDKE